MVMEKVLGIDYGTKKIGLSIADIETKIAFNKGYLINNKKFLEKLEKIIKEEKIIKIIVGLPQYHNDKNEISERKEIIFKRKIERKFNIPIEFENEIFTTKIANQRIIEKKNKLHKIDDEEAARIILQEWLDKNEI